MTVKSCQLNLVPTTLVTTAETVVGTFSIPPVNNPTGEGVYLEANVLVTTGTLVTSLVVRIRQGSLTGNVVAGPALTAAAASTAGSQAQCVGLDQTQSYPAGNTYVVTVVQTAASGNGTCTNVTFTSEPVTQALG